MKKFLSMALAVIMACNFTLFNSGSIVSAEGWADYYDETWQFEGYDDEYVAFRIPQQSFKNLINSGNYKLVKYDGNDVIIEFHKEDVKEIIEEKPSKLKKFLKAVLWAAYTGIAAITSCGLYRIYNQHIDRMDKDKTTINENSTLFERIDANAANYTKMFNLYVDGTISPNLFGNASVFNKGINGTKGFIEAKFKGMQTFLDKIRSFGKKTNSSNTNTQQPTNSSNTNTQQQTQKPVETPQPQASPSPAPLSKEQLEELQEKIDFDKCYCLGKIYDDNGKCLQPGGLLMEGEKPQNCTGYPGPVTIWPKDKHKGKFKICRRGYGLVNNECIESVNDLNTDASQLKNDPSPTPLPEENKNQPEKIQLPPTQTPDLVETTTNISDTNTQQQTQKPVETPQPQASSSPSATPLPTETSNPTNDNAKNLIVPEQEQNTCGEGFTYKDGKCVPNN